MSDDRQKKYSAFQPKDGDLILVCGHERDGIDYHWYVLDFDSDNNPTPRQFKRPDGSVGEATWACICDNCKHLGPDRAVRGERIWTGDEPIILEQVQ